MLIEGHKLCSCHLLQRRFYERLVLLTTVPAEAPFPTGPEQLGSGSECVCVRQVFGGRNPFAAFEEMLGGGGGGMTTRQQLRSARLWHADIRE